MTQANRYFTHEYNEQMTNRILKYNPSGAHLRDAIQGGLDGIQFKLIDYDNNKIGDLELAESLVETINNLMNLTASRGLEK